MKYRLLLYGIIATVFVLSFYACYTSHDAEEDGGEPLEDEDGTVELDRTDAAETNDAGDAQFFENDVPNGEWTTISSGHIGILSLFFIDSNRGWAVGDNGEIIVTTDGGETWSLQNSDVTGDLHSVYFASNRIGFAAGYQQTILSTSDRGGTWQQLRVAGEEGSASESGMICDSFSADSEDNLVFEQPSSKLYQRAARQISIVIAYIQRVLPTAVKGIAVQCCLVAQVAHFLQ